MVSITNNWRSNNKPKGLYEHEQSKGICKFVHSNEIDENDRPETRVGSDASSEEGSISS